MSSLPHVGKGRLTYPFAGIANADDLREDINEPLWLQNYDVFQRRKSAVDMSEVNYCAKIVVEAQHCLQTFSYLELSCNVLDLERHNGTKSNE